MSSKLENRKWYSGMTSTEDYWSVWIAFFFILLGLLSLLNIDLVGWLALPGKWGGDVSISKAISPIVGKAYKNTDGLDLLTFSQTWKDLGWWNILVTYIMISIPLTFGAYFMKWNVKKFFAAWTVLFALTYTIWILGSHAFISADVTNQAKYGLENSLSLGGGGAFIIALFIGLIIGNFFKSTAEFLKPAAKTEWFIKTAIVFLGVKVGFMAIQATDFVFEIAIAGAAATIVAYLIFWPGTYLIARKLFKLPRKTSAVIASGISICGVSAAVATAGAVRAKPIIPVMVSALIVIYAVIELVIIPPLFTATMMKEPIVAGAAMGMAIKTDGADAAAGAIMDDLMRSKKLREDGVTWKADFIMQSAIMTKIWIDMFIGVWAFVLAFIWIKKVDKRPGETIPKSEIWHRFPKFVIAYFISWFVYLGILFIAPELSQKAIIGAVPVEGGLRKLFFMFTFLSIGINTDFKKLAEARFGKMIFIYFIALFVFIIPIAIAVAWVFHHGMQVPVEEIVSILQP